MQSTPVNNYLIGGTERVTQVAYTTYMKLHVSKRIKTKSTTKIKTKG